MLLSEEKNQKTFMSCVRGQTEVQPASCNLREAKAGKSRQSFSGRCFIIINKSFLVLFFKKERAFFLTLH